jgi:hypothetical protein
VSHRLVLVTLTTLALTAPTQAGLFKRSSKPDPAVHVPALIQTLKTDKDERARASAASDLHEYDGKAFPEILPALMEALASDPSPSVRAEAAESIGKIRPISTQAGYALEQARDNDRSTVVKFTARTALMKYRFLGVIGGRPESAVMQTAEPPLAAGLSTKTLPSPTILRPTPSPVPVMPPSTTPAAPPAVPPGSEGLAPRPQTGEPPLAEPSRPAPALTSQPRTPVPVITIPPPPREVIVPIPTNPGSAPTLPTPAPATPPASGGSGPALPPPPKN